jgi:hypothetical protein
MLIDRLINLLTMITNNKRILNNETLYDLMTNLDRQIEIFISDDLYLLYLDEKNKLYDKSMSENSEVLNNTDDFMIVIQQLIDDLKNKANS